MVCIELFNSNKYIIRRYKSYLNFYINGCNECKKKINFEIDGDLEINIQKFYKNANDLIKLPEYFKNLECTKYHTCSISNLDNIIFYKIMSNLDKYNFRKRFILNYIILKRLSTNDEIFDFLHLPQDISIYIVNFL